jgi:3-dehydroquinate dehydratase type I
MSRDAGLAAELGADVVEVRIDMLWTREERIPKVKGIEVTESEDSEFEVSINFLEFEDVDFESDLNTIMQSTETPLIFTCRPQDHGGFFPGDEKQRFSVLRHAISLNPAWIDLEASIHSEKRGQLMALVDNATKVIASMHHLDQIPSPSAIVQDVNDNGELGEVIKACYPTKNRTEGLRIFEAAWELRDSEFQTTLMGLGPGGDWSRIHAPLLNQFMVYSTTESGWHLAQQGRINAADLKTAWDLLGYA